MNSDDEIFELTEKLEEQPAESEHRKDERVAMPLMEHLSELRRRLAWSLLGMAVGFAACYGFASSLFEYLAQPLLDVMPSDSRFIYTGVAEAFFVELKVALCAGLFAASPFIFYQIWAFAAPYDREKRLIIPLALGSALFFIGGAAFCYFIVFPFAFEFFLGYSSDTIVAMLSISEYFGFSLKLLVAFGLIFEMPLFSFFLTKLGLITAGKLISVRRYAVLLIFVIAAVLTPPDVFSQLLMAVPMILLYEFSIMVSFMATKHRNIKSSGKNED